MSIQGIGTLAIVGAVVYGAMQLSVLTAPANKPTGGPDLPTAAQVEASPTVRDLKTTAKERRETKVATIDKSPAMQKRRKELIQELMNKRIFIKLETPGSLPRLSVGPAFYALDFDAKKGFVSVVYAYHFDGSDEFKSVRIYDGRTNKEIGDFSAVSGLKLN